MTPASSGDGDARPHRKPQHSRRTILHPDPITAMAEARPPRPPTAPVTLVLAAGLVLGLTGCQPAQVPDVAGDAARLTGVGDAIAFEGDVQPTAPPDDGSPLAVDQAVRLALKNDPRVRTSLAKVRVAEAEANQARLLPNPILTIDLRFALTAGNNTAFEPTIAGDLLSLLQKPATISAADKRLRASAATALVTVLDVMSEVQQAYASAKSVELELDNAGRRQGRLRTLRDMAQKRLDAGEATRLDVLTVDAQLLQADIGLSDLRLQRVQARLLLAKLVGDPRAAGDWRLTPHDPRVGGEAAAPEADWIDAALAHRPEISAARWELRALGDDYAAASLAPLAGGEVAAHGEHDPDWRLGPTLSVPLPVFDWGQAARAKVSAMQAAARSELDQQTRDIIQDVRLAVATDRHARETLLEYENKLLPLQVGQTDQARRAYQAGEADLATLILAENDLELTRSKIIELQETLAVAQIKLRRAVGGAGVSPRQQAAGTQATARPAEARPAEARPAEARPAESRPTDGGGS